MRFERDPLGLPITVDLKEQGKRRPGTDIIESKITNTPDTIGFGHTHPGNSWPGIGPEDTVAPSATGKPSFVRDRGGSIYLIENVDGQTNTIRIK